MNIKIIKIARHILYLLGYIFFLIGAILSVIYPSEIYANYLYLVCSIFFIIAHLIFDSIVLHHELNVQKN